MSCPKIFKNSLFSKVISNDWFVNEISSREGNTEHETQNGFLEPGTTLLHLCMRITDEKKKEKKNI